MVNDNINPSHYKTDAGIEANDVQKAFFAEDPWYWTAFKYMAREGKKNTPPLEDALKGLWYYLDRIKYKFGVEYRLVELQGTDYLEAMPINESVDIVVTPSGEGNYISVVNHANRIDFRLTQQQSDELVSRLLEARE